ncbi:MAG: hypothetical protein C5B52_10265 [Bacteroidetes bacterium]|nr:MAG: hypothetical protein C5B52_10265 [Bacteroidota bacterium]
MINSPSKGRALLLITAILFLANIALLIFCFWMKEPAKKNQAAERPGRTVATFLEKEIGFSPDQMKQFDQMHEAHRAKMHPLFDSLRGAKQRFYQLLNDSTASDSLLQNYTTLIGQRQQIVDREIFFHFRKIRNLCTPAQLPLYDSLVQGLLRKMIMSPRRPASAQGRDSLNKASTDK